MKADFLQSKKTILIVFLAICGISVINAQTIFQWAKNMGSNSTDFGYAIAVDASGNVYTTGYFTGIADFDPSAGTFTLSSNGSNDIFVSKLDVNGNFLWAKKIGGASSDMGKAITIDGTGNINITGSFFGTVDFDPNSGVTNLTSAGSNDIFVLKLNPGGNLIWAKNLGGTQDDKGYSIAADATGNVFTTGYFMNTADFDPSASTFTMNGLGGNENVFISKLDATGNFVWAKQFNGTTGAPQVFGNSITLDASGNVYVGGSFTGNLDFDPGASSYTVSASNMDAFITKLDGVGNFVWVKTVGGIGGSNSANAITVDASNNVYATGYFDLTSDFDPGAGSFPLTSFGGVDIFVLKLDASGSFTWAKKMGGAQGDQGRSIVVSNIGDVYTSGYFNTSGDFDPGVGTYTLSSIGGNTAFVSKLDASGNFVLANAFGHAGCNGFGLALSSVFDLYLTGNFSQITDFDPNSGVYNLTPSGGGGSDDIFILKLGQSVCPTFSINSSTSSYTLMCSITSLTINAVSTSTLSGQTYTWTTPSSTTSTGSSYIASTAGIYTISSSAASNSCIVTQTLSIIQTTGNVSFNINTTGSTCNNNGTATVSVTGGTPPFTYTWSTGSNSTSVSGLAPGNYTLTVKDANQCSATNTFVLNNTAATFSSVPICFVTVDSLSQYNIITWDKTLFSNADSFFVYRETGTNVYKKIASQPYSTLSQFIDTVRTLYFPSTGDPNIGTYRYKMKTRDNCGNYSDYSPYHNTLYIVNNNGTFTWSQLYIIEGDPNPVSAYILERDNLSNGNWQTIGSVAGTQQFIVDPNYTTYQATGSWRVRTQWNINCVATQKTQNLPSVSYSNQIKNNAIGIKEINEDSYFIVYPNPSNGSFAINVKMKGKFTLSIYNSIGDKIFTHEDDISKQFNVDLSKYTEGIYFVNLKTDSRVVTRKLILK